MQCPNCQKQLSINRKHCPNCNYEISSEAYADYDKRTEAKTVEQKEYFNPAQEINSYTQESGLKTEPQSYKPLNNQKELPAWTQKEMTGYFVLVFIIPLIPFIIGLLGINQPARAKQAVYLILASTGIPFLIALIQSTVMK